MLPNILVALALVVLAFVLIFSIEDDTEDTKKKSVALTITLGTLACFVAASVVQTLIGV